jgi:hypothetical protein
MNRSQLPCSVRPCSVRRSMIEFNPRLTSPCCLPVSILLSRALVVALSARQSHNSPRKQSLPVRNVAGSAPSSCSDLDSHQETFRFIRFTSVSPRSGIRVLMVKSTVPKRGSRSTITVLRHIECPPQQLSQRRTSATKQPVGTFAGETSSVPLFCTRISNASANVALSMPSWPPVLYLRYSRALCVRSMRTVQSGEGCAVRACLSRYSCLHCQVQVGGQPRQRRNG